MYALDRDFTLCHFILFDVYLLSVEDMDMPRHGWRSGTAYENELSLSTMWVLEIELRSSTGLEAGAFPLNISDEF